MRVVLAHLSLSFSEPTLIFWQHSTRTCWQDCCGHSWEEPELQKTVPSHCGMDRSDRSVSTSAEIRTGTEFLHQPERSKFILFCKSNKIQQLTEQVVARSVAVAYNNFPKLLCWQELPSALNSFLLPETAASKLTSVNYVEGNISSITHTHLTTALYSKLFCFTLCFYLKS